MTRTLHDHAHPYTASALDAPAVVTGPVVLAVDASGDSDGALLAASELATHLGAALEAVAALEPLAAYAIGTEVISVSPELEQSRRTEYEARVRGRLARVLGDRPWRCDVRFGSPARVVAGAAAERSATLVVAGAGRHGIGARLLGAEVALQTLRLGDRPVLAVAPEWKGRPRRILCAMDFSAPAVRAARLAAAMLADGGTLQLVFIEPPSEHVGLLGESWVAAQRHALKERYAALRPVLEAELPAGALLEETSRAGLVVDELLVAARLLDADLVAAGTQGRGFLERLFIGSTATGLLRRSTLSVLCAPPPPAVDRAWVELRLRGDARLERPEDWAAVLDAFTRRHAGRRSWLEVDDPASGAQLQQRGLTFVGATFDRHDARVALAFLDPAHPTRHLTREIAKVDWIALRAGTAAADEVLCVAHGRGQTLLGFVAE